MVYVREQLICYWGIKFQIQLYWYVIYWHCNKCIETSIFFGILVFFLHLHNIQCLSVFTIWTLLKRNKYYLCKQILEEKEKMWLNNDKGMGLLFLRTDCGSTVAPTVILLPQLPPISKSPSFCPSLSFSLDGWRVWTSHLFLNSTMVSLTWWRTDAEDNKQLRTKDLARIMCVFLSISLA